MCGIAGFVTFKPASADALAGWAKRMADAITYRGPDASGVWTDAGAGFATSHRRLSIVDLSEAGAQPMQSACNRYVISYNGEVYNAPEVRAELEALGYRFRGHSDTEVILESCAEWGVEKAIPRFIGMFALCVWDTQDRRLWLVRDRLGIKPLYWGRFDGLLVFGSELKALRAHQGWTAETDPQAISSYLRFGYIPSPLSIYRGIHKLAPGTMLTVAPEEEPRTIAFWQLNEVVKAARANPFRGDDQEAENALHAILGDAVRRRMVADVPLGAFLSGGIDSSTIVALMQEASARPIRTFSIGFHEQGYDEAQHAAAIANHLHTEHTELYVTPSEARDVIPRLPEIYDEPFADSSQIPTFLVSQMTRRHVTVALSGDGGDELFCGYGRYFHAAALQPQFNRVPPALRRLAARALEPIPTRAWDIVAGAIPPRWRPEGLGHKVSRLRDMLGDDNNRLYLQMLSHWHSPQDLSGQAEPPTIVTDPSIQRIAGDYMAQLQYIDTLTYLPDDILTKVDRASMAVSLEVRVPMIDHRVVAFAWQLPRFMQVRDGQSKWLLRRLLARFVPQSLIDRPKMGFGVPIDHWLRGPLRDWAETWLSEEALRRSGLNPTLIRARWASHLEGRENWQYPLWTIITLQAWLDRHKAMP